MSTCHKFRWRPGVEDNEISDMSWPKEYVVKLFCFFSVQICFFDLRAMFPVIPLGATANYTCFMYPILQFHYTDARCHVGLLSYLHIKPPQFTIARAALFEMVSRSAVIQFFLGFSQYSAPAWYWAFVSGNNIKTILWQLKLSWCLSHF